MSDPTLPGLGILPPGLSKPEAAAPQLDGTVKKGDPRLRQAAEQFQAMFVSEMLRPLWDGIETDGPFGGGAGEEAFRSMLIDEYGHAVARSDALRLNDRLEAALLKLQERGKA